MALYFVALVLIVVILFVLMLFCAHWSLETNPIQSTPCTNDDWFGVACLIGIFVLLLASEARLLFL